eukprot:271475_1
MTTWLDLKKSAINSAKNAFDEIVTHKQFIQLKDKIKANQFRIEILNRHHSEECYPILTHAFSKGGGNYEVIKNLNPEDMLPIAKSWVDIGINNGLSFVLMDQNNKVAFIGINEVIGYDENTSINLKLNKNGKLRRQLRHEFEKNDPFWQQLMKLNSNNKLQYGYAMAPIGASRPDLQGHISLSTLGMRYWGLFIRNMYNKGFVKYFVGDATHWKTIAFTEYAIKMGQQKYGNEYYYKSSEFDVNKYIKNVAKNKNDFVYNPKIDRKMNMYVMNMSVPKSKYVTWEQELNEAIQNAEFTSNNQIYEQSKL